jgi:phospholipid transport system substrate-binding protein
VRRPLRRPAVRGRLPDADGPAAEASATLKEGMDKLLGFLARDEVPNRLQVAAFLDREIAPYFDFEYMAKWVAGPASEGMSAEDRKAMAAHLEADFLGTLASRLMDYEGQQIRMLPPRMGPRGDVSVNVALLRAQSYPAKLEFRMYKSPTGWRVYDVVANGQSAAAYYRVQFQRMAGQGAVPAR